MIFVASLTSNRLSMPGIRSLRILPMTCSPSTV
jgi:hypothetical protein